MPVHDWTRVDSGIFHEFHTRWVTHIAEAINDGVLPPGYFANCEMIAQEIEGGKRTRVQPDGLVLKRSESLFDPAADAEGGVALLEVPPKARRIPVSFVPRPARHITIRHYHGHRVVALIEIVSPGNKDGVAHLGEFTPKVADSLLAGIHVCVVDLFPPGRHDPNGVHAVVQQHFAPVSYDPPPGEPLTVASYVGGPGKDAFLNHFAVGTALPAAPLFLTPQRYVTIPLEETYQLTWRRTPQPWRELVAGPDNEQ